jgi:hypothetical protein
LGCTLSGKEMPCLEPGVQQFQPDRLVAAHYFRRIQ